MLRSRHTAIGYDLSKIDGYDPDRIIRGHGWLLLKHHLMKMLSLSDYRNLQNGLEKSGKTLTHARMKMLKNAARGYDFWKSIKQKKKPWEKDWTWISAKTLFLVLLEASILPEKPCQHFVLRLERQTFQIGLEKLHHVVQKSEMSWSVSFICIHFRYIIASFTWANA